MAVQRTNPFGLPWSHWIAPKTNAPALSGPRGRARGARAARIFCSSATDPYTPLERRLALTRGCLEVMARASARGALVQTRSPLVLRDVALLRRLPRAGVSLTVTTADESVRRRFEPDSPSSSGASPRSRRCGRPASRCRPPSRRCCPATRPARRAARSGRRPRRRGRLLPGRRGGRAAQPEALKALHEQGFGRGREPGYAAEATAVLRRVLGPERVAESQAGFNDTGWLGPARD